MMPVLGKIFLWGVSGSTLGFVLVFIILLIFQPQGWGEGEVSVALFSSVLVGLALGILGLVVYAVRTRKGNDHETG